uniref:Uncharacterized protein n=1 Tax=viral metagenome TaxID=1070528 RepID=A0A6C0I2Z6_9ZZZZ
MSTVQITDKENKQSWMGKVHLITNEPVNISSPFVVKPYTFVSFINKSEYPSFLKKGSPLYCTIAGSCCRADVAQILGSGTFKVTKNDLKTYSPFAYEYTITINDIESVLVTEEAYTIASSPSSSSFA